LADALTIAQTIPFPTTLGNVQVTVNGIAAPIYYVAPTQVSVIVPYGLNTSVAQVQVTTDGNASNTVTTFTNLTSPGVFTVPPGGLGTAAVLHQDGTLVTSTNPAKANETVSVFLTGLGAVSPTITDGDAGPSGTLSQASATIAAYLGGTQATVTYAGLAPQLAGLYQVNVTIPAGLTAGNLFLGIAGPDSYASEATVAVAGGTAADSSPAVGSNDDARAASERRPPPRLAKVVPGAAKRKPQ
jgi:adhesin/invasin